MISVDSLVKTFGDFRAVDNVSFSVPPGQIFALLGPNGAGKSTTIKMLTTILTPSSGSVRINGYDPVTNTLATRRSFSIVFQDPSLDDELTAYENMEFHAVLYGISGRDRKAHIQAFMEFVDLWNRRNSYVKQFSGGMKRRLEIARSLLHNPRILFLDEPTLGLDPQTRNHVWGYIKSLVKTHAMTVLFTTHYLIEAEQVADNIAIIDLGKIVAHGTPETLRNQTQTTSLEEAFIKLTGHNIRDHDDAKVSRLREFNKMINTQ